MPPLSTVSPRRSATPVVPLSWSSTFSPVLFLSSLRRRYSAAVLSLTVYVRLSTRLLVTRDSPSTRTGWPCIPAGLEGTGEIRLRELVKQSLRMRPSRMMGYRQRRNPDTAGTLDELGQFSRTEELGGSQLAVPAGDRDSPSHAGPTQGVHPGVEAGTTELPRIDKDEVTK
jgi:hypothetical protein